MKKSVIIVILFLFSVLAVNLAVAQVLPGPPVTLNKLAEFFRDLLSGISEDDSLAKLLLVMLLTTILFRPAYNLSGKKSGIAFIIALLVSILGIKYLTTYDLIKGLLLPYGALAIALSSVVPFLLISALIITSEMDTVLRKITWGIMAGAFILLWWFRWTDIGDLAWIYLGLGIISLAILLFFDSTLRGFLAQTAMSNSKYAIDVQIANLNTEIANLYMQYSNSAGNAQLQNNLRNQIKAKERTRKELIAMKARMP
ncbi:MAG: hypothetical protein QW041_02210 [Candidatus Pacearchaeota archaeon]